MPAYLGPFFSLIGLLADLMGVGILIIDLFKTNHRKSQKTAMELEFEETFGKYRNSMNDLTEEINSKRSNFSQEMEFWDDKENEIAREDPENFGAQGYVIANSNRTFMFRVIEMQNGLISVLTSHFNATHEMRDQELNESFENRDTTILAGVIIAVGFVFQIIGAYISLEQII